MHMKKLWTYILIASLLPFTLFAAAAEMPSINQPVTVMMVGVIPPRDLQIIITDSSGRELSEEDAIIDFEFPSTEEWEVSQSIQFSYSSQLASSKRGLLAFRIDNLTFGEGNANALQISLELASDDAYNTWVENDAFSINFLPGLLEKKEIGTLTVKIRKRADSVFSAGPFSGSFSMSYTEGS